VHVVFAVADVARAEEFYASAFGWTRSLAWPDTYTELALSDNDRLGLYRRDGFAEEAGAYPVEVAPGKHTGTELYVRVDDIDTAIGRLRDAGARPLSPRAPREWGDEAAYFADPDGNVVAVARRLPE
jgi:catechol 2,3-dioxygenase-like lactoylglutathione lyase family enzyme